MQATLGPPEARVQVGVLAQPVAARVSDRMAMVAVAKVGSGEER